MAGMALCSLVHVTTCALYYLVDIHVPPAYSTARQILARNPGPLFTLDPIWVVASGQSIHPWPLAADSHFAVPVAPRPQAFTAALEACPTVLLDHVTLQLLPKETEQILRREYKTIFQFGNVDDRKYIEVLVRREKPAANALQELHRGIQ